MEKVEKAKEELDGKFSLLQELIQDVKEQLEYQISKNEGLQKQFQEAEDELEEFKEKELLWEDEKSETEIEVRRLTLEIQEYKRRLDYERKSKVRLERRNKAVEEELKQMRLELEENKNVCAVVQKLIQKCECDIVDSIAKVDKTCICCNRPLRELNNQAPFLHYFKEGTNGNFFVDQGRDFREAIKQKKLPTFSHLVDMKEQLFLQHSFVIENDGFSPQPKRLFYPASIGAVSEDPISGKEEYFVTVEIKSDYSNIDVPRRKLRVVFALDISDSMRSRIKSATEGKDISKLEAAENVIVSITSRLKEDDYFGLVIFDEDSRVQQTLQTLKEINVDELKEKISKIETGGGTSLKKVLEVATNEFSDFIDVDGKPSKPDYENRIIVLTDAVSGEIRREEDAILELATNISSKYKIYTTVVQLGAPDLNSVCLRSLSSVRGVNIFQADSNEELKSIFEDFDIMVTPLAFDVALQLESNHFEIEDIYGLRNKRSETSTPRIEKDILKVATVFPSSKQPKVGRGGILLLKLVLKTKPPAPPPLLKLVVVGESHTGEKFQSETTVRFFGNEIKLTAAAKKKKGLRKAILLSRYVSLVTHYSLDMRRVLSSNRAHPPSITVETGLLPPPPLKDRIRDDLPHNLILSPHYKTILSTFLQYFQSEMNLLSDESLAEELEVITNLTSTEQLQFLRLQYPQFVELLLMQPLPLQKGKKYRSYCTLRDELGKCLCTTFDTQFTIEDKS